MGRTGRGAPADAARGHPPPCAGGRPTAFGWRPARVRVDGGGMAADGMPPTEETDRSRSCRSAPTIPAHGGNIYGAQIHGRIEDEATDEGGGSHGQ